MIRCQGNKLFVLPYIGSGKVLGMYVTHSLRKLLIPPWKSLVQLSRQTDNLEIRIGWVRGIVWHAHTHLFTVQLTTYGDHRRKGLVGEKETSTGGKETKLGSIWKAGPRTPLHFFLFQLFFLTEDTESFAAYVDTYRHQIPLPSRTFAKVFESPVGIRYYGLSLRLQSLGVRS